LFLHEIALMNEWGLTLVRPCSHIFDGVEIPHGKGQFWVLSEGRLYGGQCTFWALSLCVECGAKSL